MKHPLFPYQIVIAVASGTIGGIIAILGELRDDLGFSNIGIGLIVAAGFFAAFVSQIALARYADRGYGRELATVGAAISAMALLAMVFADTVIMWVLCRAALGFATGMIMPGLRRAASVLDPAKAGENLGRLVTADIVGFIMGPMLAATLVWLGDLRTPFLVFGFGMILFLPVVSRLPRDQGVRDTSKGSPLELLRIRRLQGALILMFGYFVLIGFFEAVLPVMFKDRGGGSAATGIAFTVLALPMMFVSTRAGRTADRVGAAKIAVIGMGLSGLAAMSYGFLPGIVLPCIMMGTFGIADGYGFTGGQVAVSRAVSEDRQAGALGLMGAFQVLGAGLAAIPAAILYEKTGDRVTWLVGGGFTLLLLGVGHWRLRGTEPVSTTVSASDLVIDLQPHTPD